MRGNLQSRSHRWCHSVGEVRWSAVFRCSRHEHDVDSVQRNNSRLRRPSGCGGRQVYVVVRIRHSTSHTATHTVHSSLSFSPLDRIQLVCSERNIGRLCAGGASWQRPLQYDGSHPFSEPDATDAPRVSAAETAPSFAETICVAHIYMQG